MRILRNDIAISEKDGYTTENHIPLTDDERIGLKNRQFWEVASWNPA